MSDKPQIWIEHLLSSDSHGSLTHMLNVYSVMLQNWKKLFLYDYDNSYSAIKTIEHHGLVFTHSVFIACAVTLPEFIPQVAHIRVFKKQPLPVISS